MASGQGSVSLDFGGSGANAASVVVTGQTGITTAALVEVWIFPRDTSGSANGHTEDEHAAAHYAGLFRVTAPVSSIVNNTGFTIYGQSLSTKLKGPWNIAYAWNG